MNRNKIANADEAKLRKTLIYIISLLVDKQYQEIETFTGGRDLDADTIQQIADEWPSPLVMPPSDSIEDLIYTVQSVSQEDGKKSWLIDALLYSELEGRSDLTLQLVIDDAPGELYQVSIDDLGVM